MLESAIGYFPQDSKLVISLNKKKEKLNLAKRSSKINFYSTIIEKLIQIGKDYEYLSIDDIFKDKNLVVFSSADQFKMYKYFMNGTHGYTSNELSNILKGAMVSEIKLMKNEWGYGSVSSTIAITFALIAVDYKQAERMMEWAELFGFRSYYFHYGQGIRKSPELHGYILRYSENSESIEFAERELENYKKDMQYKEDGRKQRSEEVRKRKAYANKLISNDVEDRKNGLRGQLIEELNSLSPYEKLVKMADDTRHSVKYYPKNMAYQITKEDFSKLSSVRLENIKRMSSMKLKGSTPWGQFKFRLLES